MTSIKQDRSITVPDIVQESAVIQVTLVLN